MQQNKEPDPSTAPIPFRNHTALLLGVALPYLQPAYRHPIELALKFLEFTETLRLYREFHSGVGACAPPSGAFFFGSPDTSVQNSPDNSGFPGLISAYITDLEGLLSALSAVCTGSEQEIIGMFLNLIRAKNFYNTYGELLQSQFADFNSLSGLFSDLPPKTAATPASTDPAPAPFATNLSGMLNAEQKETLDLLRSLFSED